MRLTNVFGLTVAAMTVLAVAAVPFSSRAEEAPKKAEAAKKLKALIITGDDVDVHNWAEVSQAVKHMLVSSGKFDVRICEDTGILAATHAVDRYDVIFLHMYNQHTPTLTPMEKGTLNDFVRNGKGLVISHLTSASFAESKEFRKMCGRYWVMGTSGHGPRSPFRALIADKNHPITQGLNDFEADDELYAKLQGDEPINVLVEAESPFSKKIEPLAFTVNHEKGRVFHETFGHDVRALNNPSVRKLIIQGCEWAATGKVEGK